MSTLRRRVVALGATAVAATLVMAGCASTEPAAEETTATGSDACAAYEAYLGNEGTEVEIYTTIIDPEASLFIESFAEF
ncbi:MAG: hypothetical protein RL460_10, partial [Actinomycetota bacterium]